MFWFTLYYPFQKGLSSNIMQLIYMFIPPRYGMGAITPVSTSTLIIKDSLTCLTHGLSNIIIELVKIITMIYISTISINATQCIMRNRYIRSRLELDLLRICLTFSHSVLLHI